MKNHTYISPDLKVVIYESARDVMDYSAVNPDPFGDPIENPYEDPFDDGLD